jgi:hypothetical protein
MNFLTPWFLWGALAVAGPVLFHLIRRAARERMPFSSLMFLAPTPPRTVRRRKLEHLLLLLLRWLFWPAGLRARFSPKTTRSPRPLPPAANSSCCWIRARACDGKVFGRKRAPWRQDTLRGLRPPMRWR